MIVDICNAAKTVPAFSVQREFDLSNIATARQSAKTRIGWAALFARGYSLVAKDVPELRQTFITLPWMRLYQHPTSVVNVTVNRFDQSINRERLLWARIRNVETLTLAAIQKSISEHQTADLKTLFRDGQVMEKMPAPIRWLSWHLLMRWQGRKRARRLGTFTISTLANLGTTNDNHPLIATSSLSYSPLTSQQRTIVTLLADHRVLDGALAARALVALERVMQHQIVDELASLA